MWCGVWCVYVVCDVRVRGMWCVCCMAGVSEVRCLKMWCGPMFVDKCVNSTCELCARNFVRVCL